MHVWGHVGEMFEGIFGASSRECLRNIIREHNGCMYESMLERILGCVLRACWGMLVDNILAVYFELFGSMLGAC